MSLTINQNRSQNRDRSSITSEEIYLLSDEIELGENAQITDNNNSQLSFRSPTTSHSNISIQSDFSHMEECFVCFENEVNGNLPIKLEDIDELSRECECRGNIC